MSNKITNPLLEQLILEIVNKTSEGRMTNVNWESINKSKQKKVVKEVAPATSDVNIDNRKSSKPSPTVGQEKQKPQPKATETDDSAEKIQADTVKTKAKLEKAKAEKDQAEEELKKHAYIKLNSSAGVQFLLGRILDHAFKTNTIDALASEMVQKLKIDTPEDLAAFSEDAAPYRIIPGMPELLASMEAMATKQV